MRNFRIFVPPDCSAARSREEHEQAIEHMQSMASADVTPSPDLQLEETRAGFKPAESKASGERCINLQSSLE